LFLYMFVWSFLGNRIQKNLGLFQINICFRSNSVSIVRVLMWLDAQPSQVIYLHWTRACSKVLS
jgi:hypothetical protein